MLHAFRSYVFLLAAFLVIAVQGGKQRVTPYKEKREVLLNPSIQNIPLDDSMKTLRPPKPVPIDDRDYTIFVGLSAFRDELRCGKTIFTGFKRAAKRERIQFGVVDQLLDEELSCIEAYCELAREEWPELVAESNEECPFRDRITHDKRDANDSRGPTLARHYQQKLVGNQDFCLQLDAHSIFTNNWDVAMYEEWLRTDNEMAVLSTYLHNLHNFVSENGDTNPPNGLPHLCKTKRGGRNLVRNEGASIMHDVSHPQMTALWGAGFAFSKCHAEKRVPIDPYTLWMFDGEEFLRSSHLWTYGYDLYSPSKTGHVVYHNYSKVPARFERVNVPASLKKKEGDIAANRFNLLVGRPFIGEVNTHELDIYGWGSVRSFQSYLNFSGVTFQPNQTDKDSCYQLNWVPYEDPTQVEELVPGYSMLGETTALRKTAMRNGYDVKTTRRFGEQRQMDFGFLFLAVIVISAVALYMNDALRFRVISFVRRHPSTIRKDRK